MKLNGPHKLLVSSDDVNLLGDNIGAITKNTKSLIDASMEVCLEVNTDKTKYILQSRHQNAGKTHDISIANRYFENVAQFKHLGTTITNQNLIQDEIKRVNSGNACCGSVQKLLSSHLLSKNIKIRIYRTIMLPVVLYGCETWCLAMREKTD
jgi:hypothetical protein